eukprot:gene7231-biopygen5867
MEANSALSDAELAFGSPKDPLSSSWYLRMKGVTHVKERDPHASSSDNGPSAPSYQSVSLPCSHRLLSCLPLLVTCIVVNSSSLWSTALATQRADTVRHPIWASFNFKLNPCTVGPAPCSRAGLGHTVSRSMLGHPMHLAVL